MEGREGSSSANQAGAGSHGGRVPTLRDVAARAGLSASTASLVIRQAPGPSAASRERVLAAAAELGYRPNLAAQVLRRNHSGLLGVLLAARDPFQTDILESIYPAAEAHGYEVVLSSTAPTRGEAKAVEALLSSRCEALILLAPTADAATLAALGRRVPVVAVNPDTTRVPVDNVRSANSKGASLAVDHLVDLGHQDIAHIAGGGNSTAAERRRGYRAAMRRHDLADHIRILPGDYTEAAGIRAAMTLLDGHALPTAVLACNDRCAIGMLAALRDRGVDVPGDMSVVGYDDIRYASMEHIELTTLRQNAPRLAQLAVIAAVERLNSGRDRPRTTYLEPHLIARRTSGPPRQSASEQRPSDVAAS